MQVKKKWLRPLLRRRFIIALLLLLQVGYLMLLVLDSSRTSQIFSGAAAAASFLAALHILTTREKGAYKITWLFLLLGFPVFGVFFYLFVRFQSAPQRMNQKITALEKKTRPLFSLHGNGFAAAAETAPDYLPHIRYLQETAGFPIYSNTDTAFYSPGEAFLPVLLEELRKAEHYIFMEYFIIEEGKMWDSILDVLKEKARNGVTVRLLYDDVGCFLLLPRDYPKELAALGIECRVFNPFVPFLTITQNNRDHRKICVIDGKVAFTGGINLADEYINAYEKHGHWKDAGIRLRGDAAWSFTLMFLEMWQVCRPKKTPEEDFTVFDPHQWGDPAWEPDGLVLPYADSPMDLEHVGEHVYMQIINSARRYVYINTPYLIIEDSMVSALCLAAKSGVDVRIVTPQRWDKRIVHMTTRSYYRELLEAGVKVYEYTGGFNHAKTFVSDDLVATVGTVNMDFRSLYLHFECGVWLHGARAVAEVRDDFHQTLPRCTPITKEDCKKGFFGRLFESLLRLISPML